MQLVFISLVAILGVLILASLSGLFSERSGVVNVGIEGMMTTGALVYAMTGIFMQESGNGSQVLAIILGGLAGMVLSMLHAFVAVSLRGNQVISGTALNMLTSGISLFLIFSLKLGPRNGAMTLDTYKTIGFASSGMWSQISILIIPILLIAIGAWALLKYTKWGLRVRTVGENPIAAESVGINVIKTRYQALLLSGLLAGMGGAMYVQLPFIGNSFTGSVGGYGFLALGILIFGQWKVNYTFIAALLFATFTSMATYGKDNGWGWAEAIPREFLQAAPYILSIAIMIFTAKTTSSPKALGVPYFKKKSA